MPKKHTVDMEHAMDRLIAALSGMDRVDAVTAAVCTAVFLCIRAGLPLSKILGVVKQCYAAFPWDGEPPVC